VWTWIPQRLGDTKFTSEPLITNNMLFISTETTAYGVELSTKRLVWSWPKPGRFALSANGVLYISDASNLTAINVK